jgi:recombination protein RecA
MTPSPAASLLERLRTVTRELDAAWKRPAPLVLGWEELGAILPDGGLPRGVVEICAPSALGGGTKLGLLAVRAAQAEGPAAWCAWIDPDATLYAPGVAAAGVDLARLLVVRPTRAELPRVLQKIAQAEAMSVVVADMDPIAGGGRAAPPRRLELLVRRLALAAEKSGSSIVLLTDRDRPRPAPWPVALRLEVGWRERGRSLSVRVTKDARGRTSGAREVGVPWP